MITDTFTHRDEPESNVIICAECQRLTPSYERSDIISELCGWCAQSRLRAIAKEEKAFNNDKNISEVVLSSAFMKKGVVSGAVWEAE